MFLKTKNANPQAIELGKLKDREFSDKMFTLCIQRIKGVVLKEKLPIPSGFKKK
jgi:hypothetical protein